jgi:hypothetical protein
MRAANEWHVSVVLNHPAGPEKIEELGVAPFPTLRDGLPYRSA